MYIYKYKSFNSSSEFQLKEIPKGNNISEFKRIPKGIQGSK